MLSTQYRLRLEFICSRIVKGEEVQLSEMIWANKLAKANQSAASMLRQARRAAANPKMNEEGLDNFLNQMDIGGPSSTHKTLFDNPDDITEWFHHEKTDDWRQRD